MIDTPFTTTISRIRHEATAAVIHERARIIERVMKLPATVGPFGRKWVYLDSVLGIIEGKA